MKAQSAWLRAVTYSGLYVGAVIGAGFASGQEVLQFFAAYGAIGIFSTLLITLALMWYGTLFMELGYHLQTNNQRKILQYLCGEKIGFVSDFILLFFMFGFVVIMISGGGAAVEQYWGVEPILGRLLIAIITFITVYFGFSSATQTLGIASPLMILGLLIISVITFTTHSDQLSHISANIAAHEPPKASAFWWTSAILYMSYNIITGIATFSSIGKEEKRLSVVRGAGMIGGGALGVALLFIVLALLADLPSVVGYEVPFLEIARRVNGPAGFLFAILLLVAVFTTAVSNLYGFCVRFCESGSGRYKLTTIITTILAFFASIIPFSKLVGILYPLFGVLGLLVMVCALYKTFTGGVFKSARKD